MSIAGFRKSELLAAGVDYINTNDLSSLRDFLLAEDPNPSHPHVPLGGG